MKATDSIREILASRKMPIAALASRLGVQQGSLRMRLLQDNLSIHKLHEMTRVLDYKVIIVPRDVKLQDGWYEVE